MTFSFSTAELAGLQAAQDGHMMDTCTIDAYTESTLNAYGMPATSYVSGSAIACGFEPATPKEGAGSADAPMMDARLRLPIGTTITAQDRITITARHGVSITATTYEVVGDVKRGPSGLWLDLKRVPL